jgi:hypothetical protein
MSKRAKKPINWQKTWDGFIHESDVEGLSEPKPRRMWTWGIEAFDEDGKVARKDHIAIMPRVHMYRENPDAEQPWRRFRVTMIVEEVTDGDAR